MIRLVSPIVHPAAATQVDRRRSSLDGAVIGLLANGKPNGEALLDRVVDDLRSRHDLGDVFRITKANPSLPPSPEEMDRLAGADVVLSAIGDCGSCSSCTVRDGIELATRGVATTVLLTEAFVAVSRAMAELCGMPGYPVVVVPHPSANLAGERLDEAAVAAARQVEAILLG